jgi:enamine deaminase RidA (YjgF/YER057c/UK114 family)
MALTLINPADLPKPESYTHAVVADRGRMVFVAGQVAEDSQGRLVGEGDLGIQARQAFANVATCLAAAGAKPDDVVRITIYVVGYRPEQSADIAAGRISVFGDHKPADTLLGVETLFEPGYLIEVEAIAVVD